MSHVIFIINKLVQINHCTCKQATRVYVLVNMYRIARIGRLITREALEEEVGGEGEEEAGLALSDNDAKLIPRAILT